MKRWRAGCLSLTACDACSHQGEPHVSDEERPARDRPRRGDRRLNARLADAIDLQTQCKQAHWNVKGPTFIALHKLFDEVNDNVEEYVDLIAERAVQLGGVRDGAARSVAKRTTLAEYAAKGPDACDHI
jgi:DNA-binding ferritin-like protein